MSDRLRVGVIGASARGGWALDSHVPAVRSLAGFELVAVATSNPESARLTRQALDVRAYSDARAMIEADDVDVVAVAVRVSHHAELVLAALRAGKHVYCEWPLAVDVGEAVRLAAAAAESGRVLVVGLQARASRAARRARDDLAAGAIGRPLSMRVFSPTAGFGPEQSQAARYLSDRASGGTLASILGGHTLDLCEFLLGDLCSVSALTTIQFPTITVSDAPGTFARTAADHLLVHGRFTAGVPLSAEIAGARPPDARFFLEIAGEEGRLVIRGGHPFGFQAGRLSLELEGRDPVQDECAGESLPEPAVHVRALYLELEHAIRSGRSDAPDATHAVRLTRLLDAVLASAESGCAAEPDASSSGS
jgi:predicted dehydrogenase